MATTIAGGLGKLGDKVADNIKNNIDEKKLQREMKDSDVVKDGADKQTAKEQKQVPQQVKEMTSEQIKEKNKELKEKQTQENDELTSIERRFGKDREEFADYLHRLRNAYINAYDENEMTDEMRRFINILDEKDVPSEEMHNALRNFNNFIEDSSAIMPRQRDDMLERLDKMRKDFNNIEDLRSEEKNAAVAVKEKKQETPVQNRMPGQAEPVKETESRSQDQPRNEKLKPVQDEVVRRQTAAAFKAGANKIKTGDYERQQVAKSLDGMTPEQLAQIRKIQQKPPLVTQWVSKNTWDDRD
jgi:hypothetical protein